MKPQDQYQHNNDKTPCSPEDQFKPVGDDSFFLDSPDIITSDHIVTTGKTYILFEYVQGKLTSATPVVLKRVLDTNDGVHVSLVDMITNKRLVRKLATGGSTSVLQWKLVDLNVLINSNNLDVIEDVSAGNEGELLEFEF